MKDRLEHFQELMQVQSATDQRTGSVGSIEYRSLQSISPTLEKNRLEFETDDFLQKADILQYRLKGCQQLVDEMKLRQSEVITQTSTDDRLEEDLDCLLKRIKESTAVIHKEISVLEDSLQQDEKTLPVERRIKKCQVSFLQRLFQEVMHDYNISQMLHRDNCKQRIVRQLEITGESKSEDEVEHMLERGDLTVFSSQLLIDTEEGRATLKLVESRHGDIIRLEKSLYELQDLFTEIATTVMQQGALVDNIEHNIREAEEALRDALPVLRKARRYHRRRCLYCCPCLQLCVVI